MSKTRRKRRFFFLGSLIALGVVLFVSGLLGCQSRQSPVEGDNPQQIITEFSTPSPLDTEDFTATNPVNAITTPEIANEVMTEEINFPPPSIDPATPIPPPLEALTLSDEVLVWILLGSDTEPPFIGRTPAIHLLFIHPRFSKASLVSIPGDLYVYIPGYTMQRLNTAYAVGGIDTLRQTLAYNFGVEPSRFVLAHPGDFQWLVDDINTIEMTVFYPMPQACGGIRAGLVEMDGALALCYASYRHGMDEVDRMQRQQQLLRVIFRKLTRDGNLLLLPMLYASYEGWVETDFSLDELMSYIPLALRLADSDRIGYFMIGWEQTTLWEIPGNSQAQVFLPIQEQVKVLLQQAIDDIMKPEPLTDQVQTFEAQLTAAYQLTATVASENLFTSTPTPILPEPTPTQTPPGYP
jgi:LCP family protein required for cell wall assembly